MPSRSTATHTCHCETCTRDGRVDDQGQPRGVPMNSREYKIHQIRLQREEDSRTLTEPTEDDLQGANDAIFASTLLGDDIVPGYCTTRASDPATPNPDMLSAMNEISASISRLALSNRQDLPSSSHTPPNQYSQSLESRKKDRSQHTVKAIKVLEKAGGTLRDCAVRLHQSPTSQTIEAVQETVKETHHVVNGINRDVEAVIDLRREIEQQLNNLEARLTELRHLLPATQSFTYVSGQFSP